MTAATGETTSYTQTDAAFAQFEGIAVGMLNAADQFAGGMAKSGVDSDTIGEVTRIAELAGQLNAAVATARDNHAKRHGGIKQAVDAAGTDPAKMSYYDNHSPRGGDHGAGQGVTGRNDGPGPYGNEGAWQRGQDIRPG